MYFFSCITLFLVACFVPRRKLRGYRTEIDTRNNNQLILLLNVYPDDNLIYLILFALCHIDYIIFRIADLRSHVEKYHIGMCVKKK